MQQTVRIGATQVSKHRHRPENPHFPTFCVPRHAIARKCAFEGPGGKNWKQDEKGFPLQCFYMFLASASFESPLAEKKPLPPMFQLRLSECAIRINPWFDAVLNAHGCSTDLKIVPGCDPL